VRLREIDDESAEELLGGTGEAPSGFERVADLLGRLRPREAPAPDEVVVTRMQAIVDAGLAAPRPPARWRRVIVIGAIAGGALAALGGLGAAGALPDAVQRPVSDLLGDLGVDAPYPSDAADEAPSGSDEGTPTDEEAPVGDEGPRATPAVPATPAIPGVDGSPTVPAVPAIPAIPGAPPAAGGTPSQTVPDQTGNTPAATAPGQASESPGATAPGRNQ
jgi:hypothetical protein